MVNNSGFHALLFSESGVENHVEKLCSEYDGSVFLAQTYGKRSLAYTQQANAIRCFDIQQNFVRRDKCPDNLATEGNRPS
ncbi:hypothetical protein MRX96_039957 [Rhipicephalus microplus]